MRALCLSDYLHGAWLSEAEHHGFSHDANAPEVELQA